MNKLYNSLLGLGAMLYSGALLAQNSCATAVPVTNLTGTVCATATPSGVNTVTPPAGCVNGTFDTWFSFVAQGGTATITVSNPTAGWRPEFVVVSSSNNACGGTLSVVQCVDQAGNYTSINGTVNGLLVGQTYWIVVSSNGDVTSGTISTCVNNPPVVANCTDNDDCLDATTITLNAPGGGATCITDCNNGAAPGLDFTGSNCEDMTFPTVWYAFTAAASAASLDVTLTSPTMTNPEFTVFIDNGCLTWTIVECVEGTAGSASSLAIPITAGQSYLIAVSDATGDQGNFNLCVTQNLDNSACNTNDNLQVTATSMGSPLTGPFLPGEVVTFCYTITDWQQINCNYLGAIVPSFGDCWAPASFNAQGMPVTVNTPPNVNGVIQPCPPGPPCIYNACSGTPAGGWNWFPAGAVNYNVAGYYPIGTAMPAGWYYLSSYNPATGACTGDPTDPDNSFGDGNFPACGTNTFDYTVCFSLIAGPSSNCSVGLTDCSVSVKTFADGEFGAWNSIGCTGDQPFNLPNSLVCCSNPTVASAVTNATCNGTSNGAINLTVSGAVAPYTFNWGGGVTTEDRTGLAAGTYTVTVSEAQGCFTTATFTVSQPTAMAPTATTTNVLCNGAATGAINLTPAGGTPGYTFNWGGGVTTEDRTGLIAGTYTVTITDAAGCTTTLSRTITQPATAVGGTTVVTNVLCNGAATGAINLTPSGGTAGYTFNWGGGVTTEDRTGLAAGTYTVTITDANGCTVTRTATVTQPATVVSVPAPVVTNTSCGNSNGAVNISPTGGTPGYTFIWSTGATTEDITGLLAGNYAVTVRDANNCSATATATVTQPGALVVPAPAITNLLCNGASTGAINITPSGGTAPYTFAWSNGATTEDITGLIVGSYTVTVTDNSGGGTSTPMTAYNETFNGAHGWTLNVSTGTNNADANYWEVDDDEGGVAVGGCGVANNGDPTLHITSTVLPSGGAAYNAGGLCGFGICVTTNRRAESPAFSTVGMPSPTLRFQFISNGQALTDNASVWYNSGAGWTLLTASIKSAVCGGGQGQWAQYNVQLPASCANNANVRVGINWTNNDDGAGTDPSVAINNVSVVDTVVSGGSGNCSVTSTFNVTQPTAVVPTSVVTNVLCNGAATGAINLTPAGGTAGYTFNWGAGVTTEDRTGLAAGSYTVTVSDANGCTGTHTATITQPATAVGGTTTTTSVSCLGGANGSINLTPSGGTAGYTFNWGGGITTEDRTGLAAGSYTVTITDANGCTATRTATITQPATAVSASSTTTAVLCNGGSNGAINLTPAGGTAGYTFNWGGGITTEDRTGLTAGTYTVTVTDANSCTATHTATITQPAAPVSGTLAVIDILCNGNTTGSIDLTPTGGTPGYTFNWGGGVTTEDRTGLAAGLYTVTITDANGCTGTQTTTIVQPPTVVSATSSVTNVLCNGASTGAINLTPAGGTNPYTFNWGGGINTEDRTGLAAGTYTVTVSDDNGCVTTHTATITQPATTVSASSLVTNALCNASATGAINLTPAGGTAGYTFNWGGGITTEDRTGLAAGSYTVTVSDANSCTTTHTATIGQPTALSTSTTVTDASCGGAADGAVNLTVSGGTAGYSFAWSNGTSNEDLANVPLGAYTVTITDANGCTTTASANVSTPSGLTFSSAVTNVLCNGASTGSANITVGGGTPGYTYAWTGGTSAEDLSAVPAGVYNVTITDANSCALVQTVTITEPNAFVTSAVATDADCNGAASGSIDLNVSGATAGYSFAWSNTATSEDLAAVAAGSYTVTITDANGCTTTESATIAEPTALQTSTTSITDITCSAQGAVNITVSGGTTGYTFAWSNGASTEDLTALSAAGAYTVTITDANGCTIVNGPNNVASIGVPVVSLVSSQDVNCNGDADGSISINVSGGTTPYTFAWTGGSSSEDPTGLSGGSYNVTVTDDLGCTATLANAVVIDEPTALTSSTVTTDANCNGETGAVALTVSGGTSGYTFLWSDNSTSQDLTATAGTYSVTITDANGCEQVETGLVIAEPAALTLSAIATDASCALNDGVVTTSVAGGTTPYTYLWSNTATTSDLASLVAGTYSVVLTDANGCTATATATVAAPTVPSINPVFSPGNTTTDVMELGNQVTITGANDQTAQGVSYLWTSTGPGNAAFGNSSAHQTTAQPDAEGTYVFLLTATSAEGCVDTGSIVLVVEPNNDPYVPTAFTPNGDGQNDLFQVVQLDKSKLVEFKVYNRFGELVYNDAVEGAWNGEFRGQLQARDVYMYVITWQLTDQEPVTLRGEVTLLR